MATLLDFSLLRFLMPLFVFIFIFAAVYALVSKTEIFGKNQALKLLLSISVAAVSLFAGSLVTAFGSIIPWLVFIVVIVMLIFAFYTAFGVKSDEVWNVMGGQVTIFVIILVVIAIGLTAAFKKDVSPFEGERDGVSDSAAVTAERGGDVQSETIRTLTHPRLLAALFILVVASFTVRLIVEKVEEKK